MKVLFLTKYPYEGASSRYRVYQYLPSLAKAGVRYSASAFMSPRLYRLSQRRGNTCAKVALYCLASLRRLSAAFRCFDCDVVYMQRECLPAGPLLLERWFRLVGKRLVFDYDDALFIYQENERSPLLSRLKDPRRVPRIMALSDYVFAGNDWLRDRAASYCKRAITFPVAEDLERYTVKPLADGAGEVVIGWLGSPSTEKYLDLVKPVLLDLADRHPRLRLRIVGGGEFSAPGLAVEHLPWSLDTEVELLHSFDIGIMPLPLEDWSRGKSGGKARTYMAVGLPCVCTDIGFNRKLIRDGETGMLASSPDDWRRALERLIGDPGLRREIGAAARREVEAHYSLEKLGPEFARLLRQVKRDEDARPHG